MSTTPSQSNVTSNQYPEVRVRQNTQVHNVSDAEPAERQPPPNWRTNIKMDEKLNICRIYYIAGFFFLPFLWLVNFFWHYNDAFKSEPFEEQPQFRRYVMRSGVGFIFWSVLLISWVFFFQTQRYYHEWDDITFNFPTGSA